MSVEAQRIPLSGQLAEAQRIVTGTRAKLDAIKASGHTPSSAQILSLHRREAIVITLKKIILNESPLN